MQEQNAPPGVCADSMLFIRCLITDVLSQLQDYTTALMQGVVVEKEMQARYVQLFGTKESCLSIMIKLTELLLKIMAFESKYPLVKEKEGEEAMSIEDTTILHAYMQEWSTTLPQK